MRRQIADALIPGKSTLYPLFVHLFCEKGCVNYVPRNRQLSVSTPGFTMRVQNCVLPVNQFGGFLNRCKHLNQIVKKSINKSHVELGSPLDVEENVVYYDWFK